MANATVTVLEADGVTQTDVVVLDVGRQAAAASKSVAMATEDKAVFDSIAAATKAEDAASADADIGIPAMAVRKATPANTSGTDGDYEMLQMSAGRLWTDSNIRFAGTTPDLGSGTGGSATQRVIIDSSQFSTLGQTTKSASAPVTIASDQGFVGSVGGNTIVQSASSTITRPADTTAYASGDLVANSTTAGSVAALQFTTLARTSGGSGVIVGARIQKSTTSTTNAAFRIHYFSVIPTFTSAGDNSAISSVVVASAKGYLGYVDITSMVAFSDVAWGTGAPDNSRGSIPYVAAAQIIYAIVEARGAYTPGNAEVFTISTFALQD